MTERPMRSPVPRPQDHPDVRWLKVSIAAGLAASLIYPLIIFAPLPLRAAAAIAAFLGPAIGIASFGIYKLLRSGGDSVLAGLGLIHNVLAGCVLTTMIMIQLAVRLNTPTAAREVYGVWWGVDVAWDVYIALGTLFFAYAMWRHPRFGRVFALTGAGTGLLLLVLNLAVFPVPPANAGLFDPGPLMGIWYLAVTIQMWRSLKWVRSQQH